MLSPSVHLTNKPVGESSFSHLQKVLGPHEAGRRMKACHGGTLDPFAHGLLLVLVGPATHFFEFLHELPKVYEADIAWGVETDNFDSTGKVVATHDAQHLTPVMLEEALSSHTGWREQVPPSTSAKKIAGEPAYKKVHRGEEVVLPASSVYLHEAQFLSHALPHSSRLRLVCRGGYYVRALVRDLGRQLGTGAHVKTLYRAAIGPWECPKEDETVATVSEMPFWAHRTLTDAEMGEVRRGNAIEAKGLQRATWRPPAGFPWNEELVCAWHQHRLVALLASEGPALVVRRLLPLGIVKSS